MIFVQGITILFWTDYIVKLRSENEAIIHAKKYNNQIQHMKQVLSSYSSSYLALSTPASMKLPRLCWEPFLN